MWDKTFFKILSTFLIVAMIFLTLPAQSWAMFLPSTQTASARQADLNTIQKTLESTVIKQRLLDLGLSSGETLDKINMLSDEQIHQVASNLDSRQAGGEGVGLLIFLLLVAIIVVVILQFLCHLVIV